MTSKPTQQVGARTVKHEEHLRQKRFNIYFGKKCQLLKKSCFYDDCLE